MSHPTWNLMPIHAGSERSQSVNPPYRPEVRSSSWDPRLDLTDLYTFQAPADPARTLLILNCNTFVEGKMSAE